MRFLFAPIRQIPVALSMPDQVVEASVGDMRIKTMSGPQMARMWSLMESQDWAGLYALLSDLVDMPREDVDRIPPSLAMAMVNFAALQSKPGDPEMGKSSTR